MKLKSSTLFWQLVACAAVTALFWFARGLQWLPSLFFLSGVVIGFVGLWLDEHVLYRYYQSTAIVPSQGEKTPFLISRSLLFLIILLPLSIFVASSTGNTIGQGFVLALLLCIIVEMISFYRYPSLFNQRFAHHAKKPLSDQEKKYGVLVFGLVTALVAGITLL